MKTPFFSVVIPLYNKQDVIANTIKSVLAQTFTNFELLVIDDGSTDNSTNIVNGFSDERIKLIKQKNGGEGAARNTGILSASADYISLLDADDTWENGFLEKMYDMIRKYPAAGMYCTAFITCFGDGQRILYTREEYLDNVDDIFIDDYFDVAGYGSFMYSSSITIPKKVFKDVGLFVPRAKMGADLEMWARIMLKYKMAYSPRPYVNYINDLPSQATQTNRDISKFQLKTPLGATIYAMLKNNEIPEDKINSVIKYYGRVFSAYADILISLGGESLLKELCENSYAKLFAPKYLSYSNNKIKLVFYKIKHRFCNIYHHRKIAGFFGYNIKSGKLLTVHLKKNAK